MKQKTKKTWKWIGIIFLALVVLSGIGVAVWKIGFTQETFGTGTTSFTPIYCNDYSFTCCVEDNIASSASITKTTYSQCPSSSIKCTINSFSPQYNLYVGSKNCDVKKLASNLFISAFVCDDDERITSTGYQVKPGYFIHGDRNIQVSYTIYNQKLIFTGRAGSTIGVDVPGADKCTFNPTATYKDGKLVTYDKTSTSYTVPVSQCVQSYVAGDRHICGNIEEQCSTDDNCNVHTYGNYECIGNSLQKYGCKKFSTPSYLESFSSGYAYKPFLGSNTGEENLKSRCEIVEAKTVQCCGDNQCGSNAFCDTNPASKTAWTCQTQGSVVCKQDSDCGVSQQCDINTKEIKKPVCSIGKCTYKTIEKVGCCSNSDCAVDYFCDKDNECKQSGEIKVSCPFECCPVDAKYDETKNTQDSKKYFDKPCSPGEYCKADNTCTSIPPQECKWYDLACIAGQYKLAIAIIIGLITALFMFLIIGRSFPKDKAVVAIISLLLGFLTGGIIYVLIKAIIWILIVIAFVMAGSTIAFKAKKLKKNS